jgi:hypothetical protein
VYVHCLITIRFRSCPFLTLKNASRIGVGRSLLRVSPFELTSAGSGLRAQAEGGRVKNRREIVSTLSRQLTAEHGRGFSQKSLSHMIRMAENFPDREIVQVLAVRLTEGYV